MSSFSRSVDLLHRAMDASTLRYQVSANNLANAEVPNFKRTSISFESELKRAIESERNSKDAFQMITTHEGHIQSEGFQDYHDVEPRRVTDYYTMDILKTQLNYQLLTQMQAFEFSQVKIAMQK